MDETHRRFHAGRFSGMSGSSDPKDFGPSQEENIKQTELQAKTEEEFKSPTTEETKKVRDKTRSYLESIGE